MDAPPVPERAGGAGLSALRALGDLLLRVPRAVLWIVPAAWMTLIWRLSSQSFAPTEPSFAFSVISNLTHAPLFGLLALFLAALLAPRPARRPADLGFGRAALVFLLVCAYALLDEWHQSHVPERDASLLDLVTDAVAALATLAVALYLARADANERGLRRRLLLGVVACVAAAALGAAV